MHFDEFEAQEVPYPDGLPVGYCPVCKVEAEIVDTSYDEETDICTAYLFCECCNAKLIQCVHDFVANYGDVILRRMMH